MEGIGQRVCGCIAVRTEVEASQFWGCMGKKDTSEAVKLEDSDSLHQLTLLWGRPNPEHYGQDVEESLVRGARNRLDGV